MLRDEDSSLNTDTDQLLPTEGDGLAVSETVFPQKPPMIRWIFIGKDGIRAGWSLLIFLAIVAGLLFCAHLIAAKIHPPTQHPQAELGVPFVLLNEALPFLIVLFAAWIMSKIERRRNSVYGLGGGRKLPLFFAGLGWGLACLSLLVFVLWKSGLLVIDKRLLFG